MNIDQAQLVARVWYGLSENHLPVAIGALSRLVAEAGEVLGGPIDGLELTADAVMGWGGGLKGQLLLSRHQRLALDLSDEPELLAMGCQVHAGGSDERTLVIGDLLELTLSHHQYAALVEATDRFERSL
jgi:hypothetical protein